MDANDSRAITRYVLWVIRWRWPVLLAAIALALAFGAGVRHLALQNDWRVLFSRDDPHMVAFEALENRFSKNDTILFVVRSKDGDVFRPQVLHALWSLTEAAWQIPYSTRVDSITNFQHTFARGDELIVEDLVASDAIDVTTSARAKTVALSEPLIYRRLISADATTTGVNVRIELPGLTQKELPDAVAHARGLRDDFRKKHPGLEIELTGLAVLNNAFAETPMVDMPVVMPLMMSVFIIVMAFFLRSGLAIAATLSLVVLSTLIAMGVTGSLGFDVEPISLSAPIIIFTLAVADSIHVLITLFHEMRAGGSREEALVQSFRINAQPVFLTSITTAVGFLSLNFSDSPPFRLLGNVTAFGVMVAWLYSMTFLPAAIAILPIRAPRRSAVTARVNRWVAELVVAHYQRLFLGGAAAVALLLLAIPTLRINDRFVEYFSESVPFRHATDFATEHLGGIFISSFSLDSGQPNGIGDPEYLRRVDQFADWLRSRPGVVHVNSFTDTMKRLNKNLHGDDPDFYQLPVSRELASQYLLLYEMSLPYGLDVNDQIDIDKSALRIDATYYGDTDLADIDADATAARGWLVERGAPIRSSLVTGISLMFARITEKNLESMAVGTGIGFGLIALIMLAALRSVRLGIISLVPNVLPAGMAFGVWALLVGEVGFAVSVVTGLSIGIIVDDTVHFLSKYQRARRELGLDAPDAVRFAFDTVGDAILITSTIVAAGFLVLGLSTFRVTAYMGLLTAITVVCALVVDFFLLPSLLIWSDREAAAVDDVGSGDRVVPAVQGGRQ